MPARKTPLKITKEQFFAEAMSREPNREKIIIKLVDQLHAYEKKYRLRSEIFYKLIVGTPLEDQEDFLDWATCYRQYFKVFQSQLSAERVAADVVG
jgi:tRNA A37 methylthiotransferase MiaB